MASPILNVQYIGNPLDNVLSGLVIYAPEMIRKKLFWQFPEISLRKKRVKIAVFSLILVENRIAVANFCAKMPKMSLDSKNDV